MSLPITRQGAHLRADRTELMPEERRDRGEAQQIIRPLPFVLAAVAPQAITKMTGTIGNPAEMLGVKRRFAKRTGRCPHRAEVREHHVLAAVKA